jgi:hypothetical protein
MQTDFETWKEQLEKEGGYIINVTEIGGGRTSGIGQEAGFDIQHEKIVTYEDKDGNIGKEYFN